MTTNARRVRWTAASLALVAAGFTLPPAGAQEKAPGPTPETVRTPRPTRTRTAELDPHPEKSRTPAAPPIAGRTPGSKEIDRKKPNEPDEGLWRTPGAPRPTPGEGFATPIPTQPPAG